MLNQGEKRAPNSICLGAPVQHQQKARGAGRAWLVVVVVVVVVGGGVVVVGVVVVDVVVDVVVAPISNVG